MKATVRFARFRFTPFPVHTVPIHGSHRFTLFSKIIKIISFFILPPKTYFFHVLIFLLNYFSKPQDRDGRRRLFYSFPETRFLLQMRFFSRKVRFVFQFFF